MQKYTLILFSLCFFLSCFAQKDSLYLYFEIGSVEPNKSELQKLKNIIPALQNKEISLVGSADTTGSESVNTELSKSRATYIRSFLITQGIEEVNIVKISWLGESNSNSELSKNRNVLIISERPTPAEQEVQTVADFKSKTFDAEINQETFDKIVKGQILNIQGLEFVPGTADLMPNSQNAMEKLYTVLKNNPGLKIEIQGHICCQERGDGTDLRTGIKNLSVIRAKTVYHQLIERGIEEERLQFQGYGSSQKLVEEDSPENQQRNRRVSILVIEK
ncbi:MAG: OmpA family protein [Brumimicrobium sp.]|nr:OmpA family protein [Brumimicrobium sp.]